MVVPSDPAMSGDPMMIRDPAISPDPTDEETAAIMAALTLAWPRPAVAQHTAPPSTAWRFSGRWWNKSTWRR